MSPHLVYYQELFMVDDIALYVSTIGILPIRIVHGR